MILLKYLKRAARTLKAYAEFKKFMVEKIDFRYCKQAVSDRMAKRNVLFLDFLQKYIYSYNKSPYLRLLRYAGYDLSRVKKMVSNYGIEATLEKLYNDGIFFTTEEFRCEKPTIRYNRSFEFSVGDFDNPCIGSGRYCHTTTGATTSRGVKIKINAGHLLQKCIYECIMLQEHNCKEYPVILWYPAPPANTGFYPLRLVKMGIVPYRRYSPVKSASMSLRRRFSAKIYDIVMGDELPRSCYLSPQQAETIIEDIIKLRRKYYFCSIHTWVGLAVNICSKAKDLGVKLDGVYFFVTGEHLSGARRKEIESSGAKVVISYYFTEAGIVGCKCKEDLHYPDCIHLFNDSLAVITHNKILQQDGIKVLALLFTNFHPHSPKIMFNTENGDYGSIVSSHCNCSLSRMGFNTLIYNIRSFEKITAIGMSLLKTDLIDIVEVKLPARFGGASCDYQIYCPREETNTLSIIISPDVGNVDCNLVKEFFLSLLKEKSIVAFNVWKNSDVVDILRKYPIRTGRGKLLSVYIKI